MLIKLAVLLVAAVETTHALIDEPQPILPADTTWAGVLVVVILGGFFLPAAVIGPIARALIPEEEPETHSHDEPPGASGHHGPGGTEPHVHGHGH